MQLKLKSIVITLYVALATKISMHNEANRLNIKKLDNRMGSDCQTLTAGH
jgi:hypothetical protein